MSANIKSTTDSNFEADVLNSTIPVLVDFWAEWCGPCKMIAPILEDVAKDYDGKLKVVKVNVDEHTQTPSKYGVRGIPSLMIFKEGNLVASKVGALSKSQLEAFINESI